MGGPAHTGVHYALHNIPRDLGKRLLLFFICLIAQFGEHAVLIQISRLKGQRDQEHCDQDQIKHLALDSAYNQIFKLFHMTVPA